MAELRIASVGTGMIVDWFLEALRANEGVAYVGCYSRSLEKAREFGEPRGATLFFDSLDELAASPDVDAVYVASPNALHIPYAKQMLAAGKHVFAEKPLASNAHEAAEAFAVAHENGVVLMEGVRNIHTTGFAAIRDALPEVGEVRSATFRFAKVSSRVPALVAGRSAPGATSTNAGARPTDRSSCSLRTHAHIVGAGTPFSAHHPLIVMPFNRHSLACAILSPPLILAM